MSDSEIKTFLVSYAIDKDPVEVEATTFMMAGIAFERDNPGKVALDVRVKREKDDA